MSADEIRIGQFAKCDACSEFSQSTNRNLIYICGVQTQPLRERVVILASGNLENAEVGTEISEILFLGFGTFPGFHHNHLPNLNAGVLPARQHNDVPVNQSVETW